MKLLLSLSLAASLLPFSAHALREETLEEDYVESVRPYFDSLQSGTFTNRQGLEIKWHGEAKPGASKTLVIFPGRTEASVKYAEVLYDLRSPSLNVFVIDHQGQGESGRWFKRTDKGHVKHFQDYINDADQFIKEIVIPQTRGTQMLLLGHSMGGLIAATYLKQHPGVFDRAILASPMLKINTVKISERTALRMASALHAAGRGDMYVPYGRPYSIDQDRLDTSFSTTSEARFVRSKLAWQEEPVHVVGDPTVDWTRQSILFGRRLLTRADEIKTKIQLFQAGKDTLVLPSRQRAFCEKVKSCELVRFEDSKHGIFEERDEIRDVALARLKSFFEL